MADVIISMDEYNELQKYKKAVEEDKIVSIVHTQYVGGFSWSTIVQTKNEAIKEAVLKKDEEISALKTYRTFVRSFDRVQARFEKWNES